LRNLWWHVLEELEQGKVWPLGIAVVVLSLLVGTGIATVNSCTRNAEPATAISPTPDESGTEQVWYVGYTNTDCFGMQTKDAMEGAIAFATRGEPSEYEAWLALHADEIIEIEAGESVEVVGAYGQVLGVRLLGTTKVFYTYYKWLER